MPLTDLAVRKAKAQDKAYSLRDEDGLYLVVTPAGGKLWRYDYRFEGKYKTLSYGKYPTLTIARARERHLEARTALAEGIDPAAKKQAEKTARKIAPSNSFDVIALSWFEKYMVGKSESHRERTLNRLKTDVFPWLGKKPIDEISAQELLVCLRRIEARGAIETAHRVRWSCSKIFRFAIASGIASIDPAELIKDALTRPNPEAFPTITDPLKIGALIRALDSLEASPIVRCASRLAPLVFVRPGELRQAEWNEIDLEKAEWRIPSHKMKSRTLHIVPLSTQSLALLHEIHPLTGQGKYVFPGERSRDRPMSENTVNAALRRLGYSKEEFTGHSFRKIASTLLNESQIWHRDAIERQLAHGERDEVRAAYNYAEHLAERVKMMQWWADYLDKLKQGGDVIQFPARTA